MSQAILTPFQIDALALVCAGNPGSDDIERTIDLDQLLDRLAARGRETTKASMQFMIRTLVHKGMIYKQSVGKRRGYERIGYRATQRGLDLAGPRTSRPAFLEPEPTGLEDLI